MWNFEFSTKYAKMSDILFPPSGIASIDGAAAWLSTKAAA